MKGYIRIISPASKTGNNQVRFDQGFIKALIKKATCHSPNPFLGPRPGRSDKKNFVVTEAMCIASVTTSQRRV
jgi:hypothetical protein